MFENKETLNLQQQKGKLFVITKLLYYKVFYRRFVDTRNGKNSNTYE